MRYWMVICLSFCGCLGINTTRKLTNEVKTAFTNRLEGNVTSLPGRIDINGYYRYWNRNEWGGYKSISGSKDTSFVDIIFYEDGTFLYNVFVRNGFSNYNDYFREVSKRGRSDLFFRSYWWGVYSLSGDTIKTQFLFHAANFTPWWGGQSWFLIKNKKTLQLILSDLLFDVTERSRELGEIEVKTASDVTFHPLEVIPPPYAWFKENKFFWRNEADWKNYVESVKGK